MANAVFERELKLGLRSHRAFLAQIVFVGCLAAVVLLAWPKGEKVGVEAALSRSIFKTLGVSIFALVTLLAPVFVAGSLTSEKEAGTLEMLLVSPVSPAQVASGKLLASVLFLVFLVLSALPVLGLCYFLGGVGGDEVVALGMHLLGFTVLVGGIGLTASVICARTHGALVVTYLACLPIGVIAVWNAISSPAFYRPETAVWLNFLEAVILLIQFGIICSRLSRPPNTADRPAEEERPEEQAVLQLQRDYFPDSFLWPERPKGYLPDGMNPIYMKEVTCEIFGRGTGLVRAILVGTLVLTMVAGFALSAGYSPVFFGYLDLCVLLIAPAFAANAFTQERERGTDDMLRTTLLTPADILMGKFRAIVRFLGVLTIFLLVPVPVSFLTVGSSHEQGMSLANHAMNVGVNLVVVLATLLISTATGLLMSLTFRSSAGAMIATYSTVFLFAVVPVAAFAVLDQFTTIPPGDLAMWGVSSPFLASMSIDGWIGIRALFRDGQVPAVWAGYLALALCGTVAALYASWRRLARANAWA